MIDLVIQRQILGIRELLLEVAINRTQNTHSRNHRIVLNFTFFTFISIKFDAMIVCSPSFVENFISIFVLRAFSNSSDICFLAFWICSFLSFSSRVDSRKIDSEIFVKIKNFERKHFENSCQRKKNKKIETSLRCRFQHKNRKIVSLTSKHTWIGFFGSQINKLKSLLNS